MPNKQAVQLQCIKISQLKVIYVYPTPDNINKIQYKDFTDTCFSFESNKVQCPKDNKDITDIPVQHN